MLPAEGRKDYIAKPREGLPPAVPMTLQSESLRMERGHSQLDLRSFPGVSRSVQGNRVVRHRAGILAAVPTRQDAGCWGIDARGRPTYDPPRRHNRPAV